MADGMGKQEARAETDAVALNAGEAGLNDPWRHLTLDGLTRLAARARPDSVAVTESPDTGVWYHRGPQVVRHGELNSRAQRLARQMLSLGLKPGDRVIVQLPNVIEHTAAVLGLVSAGLVPCPAPMGWDVEELRRACDSITAKALVTCARYGQMRPAERARSVAAEVFSVRFVCAFGSSIPDGVVALDSWDDAETPASQTPPVTQPGHVALVTFEQRSGRAVPLARTHQQLVADALALSSVARITKAASLVTTIPPATALGAVATIVIPVLTGAGAHLHGPFDSRVLVVQLTALPGAHLLVPGALESVLPELRGFLPHEIGTPILLHRWPRRADATSGPAAGPAPFRVVDFNAIGESAVFASVRQAGAIRQPPLPDHIDHPAPHVLARGVRLVESRVGEGGRLLVRGFGVPTVLGQRPTEGGWLDTGLQGATLRPGEIELADGDDAVPEPKAA